MIISYHFHTFSFSTKMEELIMQKKNTTYIADSMFAMSADSLDVMPSKTVMKLNRISFFSFLIHTQH